ncbi:MAG: undecaprenyl-diphosphatase UppP [Candidatus Eisenbacteria bacterium]|uniref:Undecaprenyl-diphosphatase n=1 Tax=Eiseniibacteriota bacterium TaxID=2212470 RepID=A0A948W853_UNCEI|nr:undecaprenyl-diphosphatase UppP [Candidatus Eisenbacteria bacterium]MBU1949323.1 undecaprenyl-diphosphatase UppP [Candidatus Eisenbacteria bacterium]MBU2692950.1 undecaprenyl-diphosphatase UppP [Candidatus Eisenbacteria bacterium]
MFNPTTWETMLLGLLQGLTEFLPVSSSGHLVFAQRLLGIEEPGVALEVVLHLGTLLAVIIYYRSDLVRLVGGVMRWIATRGGEGRSEAVYTGLLLLGTLPVVVAGFLLRSHIEEAFQYPRSAALCLLCTGVFMASSRWFRRGKAGVRPPSAILIGIFQAIALLPGVSRSGSTITSGLMLGVDAREAARFSFLLSIPAILGAMIVSLPELAGTVSTGGLGSLAAGFTMAAVSGYSAIAVLLRLLRKGDLALFGVYCILVGGLGLFLF